MNKNSVSIKFIKLSKKEKLTLENRIFKFKSREIAILVFLFFTILAQLLFVNLDLNETQIQQFRIIYTAIGLVTVIASFYFYQKITGCDKVELIKITLIFVLFIELFIEIVEIYFNMNHPYLFNFLITSILYKVRIFITALILFIGLINLDYLFNWKNTLKLYIIGIIISIIGIFIELDFSLHIFFIEIVKIGNILDILVNALMGIGLYHFYVSIEKYLIFKKDKLTNFLVLVALTYFILATLETLLAPPSDILYAADFLLIKNIFILFINALTWLGYGVMYNWLIIKNE